MARELRVRCYSMQLSRPVIARAAVEILDSYGLADVSMRRVATSLGVAPGALYWHIDSKQALIAAMADEIIAPVLASPHPGPKEFCAALREALLSHTDGADVVSTAASQADSPVFPALLDGIRASFDGDPPESAAAGLLYLTLGATSLHQAGTQLREITAGEKQVLYGSAEQVDAAVDLLLAGLDADPH